MEIEEEKGSKISRVCCFCFLNRSLMAGHNLVSLTMSITWISIQGILGLLYLYKLTYMNAYIYLKDTKYVVIEDHILLCFQGMEKLSYMYPWTSCCSCIYRQSRLSLVGKVSMKHWSSDNRFTPLLLFFLSYLHIRCLSL